LAQEGGILRVEHVLTDGMPRAVARITFMASHPFRRVLEIVLLGAAAASATTCAETSDSPADTQGGVGTVAAGNGGGSSEGGAAADKGGASSTAAAPAGGGLAPSTGGTRPSGGTRSEGGSDEAEGGSEGPAGGSTTGGSTTGGSTTGGSTTGGSTTGGSTTGGSTTGGSTTGGDANWRIIYHRQPVQLFDYCDDDQACPGGERCYRLTNDAAVCDALGVEEATECSEPPMRLMDDECGCDGAECADGLLCRTLQQTCSCQGGPYNACVEPPCDTVNDCGPDAICVPPSLLTSRRCAVPECRSDADCSAGPGGQCAVFVMMPQQAGAPRLGPIRCLYPAPVPSASPACPTPTEEVFTGWFLCQPL
jgi:hypothetical protein